MYIATASTAAIQVESYRPLLSTGISRFRIHYTGPVDWPFFVRESDESHSLLVSRIRSRLGLFLKGQFCDADFRGRSCVHCSEYSGCSYPRIFMPTFENRGKVRDISPPFVFSCEKDSPKHDGRPLYKLDLNVFGHASEASRVIVPALSSVINDLSFPEVDSVWWGQHDMEPHLPFEFAGVKSVLPSGNCVLPDYGAGLSIESCVAGCLRELHLDRKYDVEVRFQTPMRIISEGQSGSLSFHELVSRSVTRLRDIKRWYCTGGMGQFADVFWETAKGVRSENSLRFMPACRYSQRQEATIDLSGMIGFVRYFSVPGFYLPILVGGSLVHIGSKTSHGLGSFRLRVLQGR